MGWITGLIVVMIPLGAGAVAGFLANRARQRPPAWAVGMGVAGLVSLVTIIGHAFVGRDLAFWPTTPSEYQDIYAISTDGSGLTKLTRIPGRYDDPAWSPDGTTVAFGSRGPEGLGILVMDPDGSGRMHLTDSLGFYDKLAWSPNGRKIAFSMQAPGNGELYVMDADGSGQTVLADNLGWHTDDITWSPNGTKIAFTSHRERSSQIYVINADGSSLIDLTGNLQFANNPTWSPDGSNIAFDGVGGYGGDIYIADATGDQPPRRINVSLAHEPAWSPDGKKIAFVSSWSLSPTISTMNPDGTRQANLTGSAPLEFVGEPTWSSDGTNIAFWAYQPQRPYPDIYVVNADSSSLRRLATIIVEAPATAALEFTPPPFSWRWLLPQNWPSLLRSSWCPTRSYTVPQAFSWSPDGSKIVFVSMQKGARLKSALGKMGTFLAYLFFAICGPTALWFGVKSWRWHGANRVTILCVVSGAIPTLITILLLWVFLVPA